MDYLEKIYTIINTALATQSTIDLPKNNREVPTSKPYLFVEIMDTSWSEVSNEALKDVLYRGECTVQMALKFKVVQDTTFAGAKRKEQSRLMRIIEKALQSIDTTQIHTIGTSGDSYKMAVEDVSMSKDIYDINNTAQEGEAVRYFNVKFRYWI